MRSLHTCIAFLSITVGLRAQLTEIEPNESTTQATNWTYGQTMDGSECNPPSFDTDYFLIVLPSDGVITFTVTSQGSGPNPGNLQFALFPKYGFYQQYHTLPGSTGPTTQTFSHNCLSGDSMYVRVQEDNVGSNSCVDYSMSFSVAPAVFANDPGNNDDPQAPQMVALDQSFEGHLSHLYDGSADWYGVTLPVDGTLRVIAEAEHADTATTGVLNLYVDVNNTSYYLPIGASHAATIDTFMVRCFAAQSVKLSVQSGNADACGISYRIRIEQIPQVFVNDIGPNDDPQDPQSIALDTPVEGHLSFFGDGSADWYGLTLPDDGTLRVIAEAEQHDTVSTGLIQIYVDQLNSYANIPVGASSTAGVDTFSFNCMRAGLVKVRLQPANANGCGFSYRVRFQLLPPVFGNDPEPNEGSADATVVAPDVDQDGHITYIGTSAYDNYKLWKGFAGTMRVMFSSHTQGPSPALNVWTLNANVNENITTGENGEVAGDTVYVTTAGPDTIVMRVSASSFDYCGSYRFRYESFPMDIKENSAVPSSANVFPNPSASGTFTVRHALAGAVYAEVRDVQGAVVWSMRSSGGPVAVDLSSRPPGIYMARLMDAQGHVSSACLLIAHPVSR